MKREKDATTVRHPWLKWFSRGGSFSLRRGTHYEGKTHAMAQQIRNAAGPRRFNVKVSLDIADDSSYIDVEVIDNRALLERTRKAKASK